MAGKTYKYTVALDCEADTSQLKDISSAIQKIEKELNSTKSLDVEVNPSGLKGAESSIDNLITAMQDLSGETSNVSSALQGINAGSLSGLAGSVGSAGAGFEKLSKDAQDAKVAINGVEAGCLKDLNIKVVLNTDDVKTFGNTLAKINREVSKLQVSNSFKQGLDDINHAVNSIDTSKFEALGNSLKGIRGVGNALAKISKTTSSLKIGDDFTKQITALNTAINSLKVGELDNVASALGKIARAVKTINGDNVKGVGDSAGSASKAVEGLTGTVGALQDTVKGIDGNGFENIGSGASTASKNVILVTDKVGNLNVALDGIDGDGFKALAEEATRAGTAIDGVTSKASKASSSTKSFSSGGGGISGSTILAGAAGNTAKGLTLDNAMTKETNKATLKGWGGDYQKVFNQIDTATDNSTVSMNRIVPAMNAVKASTGATAEEMGNHAQDIADFGTYVEALGYSSTLADNAMQDLSKGLNGSFASLDQYGVSEEAIKNTGLWNGEKDDLDGYFKALRTVMGDTSRYNDTLNFQLKQLQKSFSRGGALLGQMEIGPVKDAVKWYTDLDKKMITSKEEGGWGLDFNMSTLIAGATQLASAYKVVKDTLTEVYNEFKSIKDAASKVKDKIFGKKKEDECPVSDTCSDKIKGLGEKGETLGGGSSGCPLDECNSGGTVSDTLDEGSGGSSGGNKKKTDKSKSTGGTRKGVEKTGKSIDKTASKTGRFSKLLNKLGNVPGLSRLSGTFSKLGGTIGRISGKIGGKLGGGLLGGLGKSVSGKAGGILSKGLGKSIGKVAGKLGAKLGAKAIAGGLVSCIPIVGQVIGAFLLLTDVLDMLGIDWWTPMCEGLQWLAGIVGSALGSAFDWIVGQASQLGVYLGQLWTQIGPQVMSLAGTIWNGLGAAFQWVCDVASQLWGILNQAWANFGPTISSLASTIWNSLGSAFQWLAGVAGQVWDALKSGAETVKPALEAIGSILSGVVGSAIQTVIDIAGQLWDAFQKLASGDIWGALKSAISTVGDLLTPIIDGIKGVAGFVGSVFSTLTGGGDQSQQQPTTGGDSSGGVSQIQAVATQVQGALSGVLTTAQTILGTIASTIATTLSTIFNTVVTGITTVVTTIGTTITTVISTLASSIMMIISTIGSSISMVVSTVASSIIMVIGSIGALIAGIGATITGIIAGIGGAISGVIAGIGAAISGIISSISGAVSTIGATIMGIINSITAGINSVGTTIISVSSSLTSAITTMAGVLPGLINSITIGLGTLATAMGGAILGAVTLLQTTFSTAFNSMNGNVIMVNGSLTTMQSSVTTIAGMAMMMASYFMMMANSVTMMSTGFMTMTTVIATVSSEVSALSGVFSAAFGQITGIVGNACSQINARLSQLCSQSIATMTRMASGMVNAFRSGFTGLASIVNSEMSGAYNSLCSWGNKMIAKAGEIASQMTENYRSNLDVGSPGLIWRTTRAEFAGTARSVEQAQVPLTNNAAAAGKGVVEGYMKGQSSVPSYIASPTIPSNNNGGNTSKGTQIVNNFNFDNAHLDSTDRVNEFAEAVIKKLTFDTVKAGRNVNNKQFMGG